ncbi:MAG: SPOR domain-containing protein [Bacteroidales bacterium]|nr:SPOR domain-containing protein [Bacteroidales bacterium]
MKRTALILCLALFSVCSLRAQSRATQDSVAVYDVFDKLSENLCVRQSKEVREAMMAHIERNEKRAASGMEGQSFRIRIYFDSGQNARAASEAAAARFRNLHPGVSVSRTFTDPFFKVTVGNYATKAEAAAALKTIQPAFPAAFIVRN